MEKHARIPGAGALRRLLALALALAMILPLTNINVAYAVPKFNCFI